MNHLSISQEDKLQYQQHFLNANPVNGKLLGSVARENLMQSGLPTSKLGNIWELADIDKDGALDFDEYCIALKLVFSLLHGSIPDVPSTLPPSLIPQSKYHYFNQTSSGGGNQQMMTSSMTTTTYSTTTVDSNANKPLEWYVPNDDKARYQGIFEQHARGSSNIRLLDADEFLNSLGIPRSTITKAWGLVDVRKYQQMNQEQFVYLLHILSHVVKGGQVPDSLPPAVRDTIYKSLNLETSSTSGANSQGYRYNKSKSSASSYLDRDATPASKKTSGLYGERSGNVALADSYLSKLKTSSTFKNDTAGSRYASSSKNNEEERKLRNELKDLDAELDKLKQEDNKLTNNPPDSRLLQETLEELEQLKEYKVREKRKIEEGDEGKRPVETLQEIKQSIYKLEGHLSFLMSEKRAMDEFISTGKQELLDLQMEQIKL